MKKVKFHRGDRDKLQSIMYYDIPSVSFSWVNTKGRNSFLQVTCWHNCRETFTGELCRLLDENRPWNYQTVLNLNRLRMAFTIRHKSDVKLETFKRYTIKDNKWAKASLKMLNIFEKSQGWALSKIYAVVNPEHKKLRANTYILVSSPKWMHAPQLLSFFLLIVRLGRYYKEMKVFNSPGDLNILKDKLIASKDKNADINWFAELADYIPLVLSNHKKLFFNGRSVKKNYSSCKTFNGISNLVVHGKADPITKKRWKKLKPWKKKDSTNVHQK